MRVQLPAGVIAPEVGAHVGVTGISRVEKYTLPDSTDFYLSSAWVRDAVDLKTY